MENLERTLKRARHFAALGIRVIPESSPTKKSPFLFDWPSEATTDAEQINEWFGGPTLRGLGIATGPESGIWVLDVDVKTENGLAVLAELEEHFTPVPSTCIVETPSGGRHYYFRYTAPRSGREWRSSLAASGSLEVKADRKKVSCSPGLYKITGRAHLADLPEAPAWLVGLATHRAQLAPAPLNLAPAPETTRYGRKCYQGALDALANAGEGERNAALFRAAATAYGLVAGGELIDVNVDEEIAEVARSAGLAAREISATMNSAKRAGQKKPRISNTRRNNAPAARRVITVERF